MPKTTRLRIALVVLSATAIGWSGVATAATCFTCHATAGSTTDIRPVDAAYRNITTGGFKGSHMKHIPAATTSATACTVCHGTAVTGYTASHRNGFINVTTSSAQSLGYSKGTSFAQSGSPVLGTCSTASCHANVYGTGSVTTPVWGSTGNGCSACHTVAIGTTGPATGSHVVHGVTDCSLCHAGATNNVTVPTANHADGNIDVLNGYSTNRAKHAAGSGYTTCSTASCHANVYGAGTVTTPVWGSTGNGCSACHSVPIGTTGPATGSHVVHGVTDCSLCHAGATNNVTVPTANHADGNIDVLNGYSTNRAKHAAGSGYTTCSTASCHANVYGAGTVTTPVWGSTGSGCSACHSVPIGTTGPATGSHAQHNFTDCSLCHTGATNNTTVPSVNHANGSINVANGYPVTAKHAAGVYTGKCSTAVCHGSLSPTWGANTANVTCTKCHGKPTLTNYSTTNAWQAAPGYAQTAGSGIYTNNVSDTAPYGAHDAHVRAVNAYTTRRVLCSDCHTVPTSSTHANGSVDLPWSNLAKNIGTTGTPSTRGTLAPTYSAGTCSANYCHGAKLAGGTNTTPTWTGTAYLTAYLTSNDKTTANCGQCHGAPPTAAPSNFAHAGITIANDCSGCHGHNGNGPTHIDGILQASGYCNSCHDYDTVGATYSAGKWTGGTWGKLNLGNYASANEGWGAHAKHINFIKTRMANSTGLTATGQTFGVGEPANVCGTCHTNVGTNHNMSATNGSDPTGRLINFGDSTFKLGGAGSIVFGTPNPVYNGVSGTSSATTAKTCSNISCHYFTTPNWSTY